MARKVLAILDIQQLFLSCREEEGPLARLDFVKLKKLFQTQEDSNVTAIAYVLASPDHDDRNFISFLKKIGYFVFRKRANLEAVKEAKEGNTSIRKSKYSWIDNMVWETLKLIPTYDEIFIVSGNGRFIPVIKAAKDQLKIAHVVSFRSSLQSELEKVSDDTIILNKDFLFDPNEVKKQKAAKAEDHVEEAVNG